MSNIIKMISDLSNLSEASIAKHEDEIKNILKYFEVINSFEIKEESLSPSISPFREDEIVKQPLGMDQNILDCSEKSEYHFFITPPIIKNE